MFAVSGFGQNFPVLIYVHERTEEELNNIVMSGQGLVLGSDKANEYISQKNRTMNDSLSPVKRRANSMNRTDLMNESDFSNRRQPMPGQIGQVGPFMPA